jgi:methionyl-tRNA synthetase
MEQLFMGVNPYTILAIVLWTLPWKAWALWLAARRGDLWWFLALIVVSTLGIVEMLYIFFIAKQNDSREA